MLTVHGGRVANPLAREREFPNFCYICNLSVSKLLPVYKIDSKSLRLSVGLPKFVVWGNK